MPKLTSIYICQQCGFRSSQFLGKCPECGTWNSLVETVEEPSAVSRQSSDKKKIIGQAEIINLAEVEREHYERLSTNLEEFDRVLGGGIVPGSVVLVSGEPGIGKSTLLLQLALGWTWGPVGLCPRPMSSVASLPAGTRRGTPSPATPRPLLNVLYVAGEESATQIKLRAERIKKGANLAVLNETDVDVVCEVIQNLKLDVRSEKLDNEVRNLKLDKKQTSNSQPLNPASNLQHPISLVIIDSIQTLETSDLSGVAGSVGQVRECAHRLQKLAKSLHIPIFLVGHVTKDGNIAGPKTLEHLVDVVLSLEGDPQTNFRILRASKNRFGSTDEIGIFEMEESGMVEVLNPSKIFLEKKVDAPGSVVVATLNGLRPIMVEIQALVSKSFLPVPRRVGSGIDSNRLNLLVAVLQSRLKLPLFDKDIFVNVTGGLKVVEPAADLGICLAIISSLKEQSISSKTMVLGEVGLLGEVRDVRGLSKRISEAKKLGITKIISPENAKNLEEAVKLSIDK